MTKRNQDLAGISDISDIGNVDMFGLDEFGNPSGLHPAYGLLIGGGVATGAAVAIRALTDETGSWYKYAEGLGFLAGAASSGVLFAMGPKNYGAGWAALAASFVSNGIRQLEVFFKPAPKAVAAPAPGVFYGPVIEKTRTLGIPSIERSGVVNGASGEPQLLGSSGPAARKAEATLVGVPGLNSDVSGMAGNFGATLWGN